MIGSVVRFFQSIVFGLSALFKRALCFLSRKRRNSGAILPTHVQDADLNVPTQVLSDSFQFPAADDGQAAGFNTVESEVSPPGDEVTVDESEAFTEWDSWDRVNSTQHTATLSAPNSTKQPSPEPEPEPDYFSDLGLAPTIQKQKKVLIKPASVTAPVEVEKPNRLAFAPEMAMPMSSELEEWDDSGCAWEDEDLTLEAEQALRQSRKAERERRLAEHQRRNQEKEQRKLSKDNNRFASRMS